MNAALKGSLGTFCSAAEKISVDLVPHGATLSKVVTLCDTVISSAAVPRSRASLQELGGLMGDLSDVAEATSPLHILHHHMAALAACAESFVWVAEPDTMAPVQAAKLKVAKHVASLRSKKDAHEDFADAVDDFLSALEKYVKEEHPKPLEWADDEEE